MVLLLGESKHFWHRILSVIFFVQSMLKYLRRDVQSWAVITYDGQFHMKGTTTWTKKVWEH